MDISARGALSRAIEKAGGAPKLAADLGLHRTTPHFWLRTQLPAERVRAVAAVSGIPPHELRPDLFDAPAD